jgi:hypothetical protein
VRHGTTSLFAALDVATGRVIGELHRRHRSQEFLLFLNTIAAQVAVDLDIHLGTTTAGPTRHRGSSALVCYADRETDKRGAHRSTRALEAAIREYLTISTVGETIRLDQNR